MSGISDTATVNLVINGKQAQEELNDLRTKLDLAKKKLVELQNSGSSTDHIKKVRKQITKLETDIERAESRSEGLRRALSGLEDFSPRELNRALRTLMGRLQGIQKGSKDWDAHIQAIQTLKEKIAEINEELKASKSLWGKFKSWSEDTWPAIDLLSRGYDTAIDTMRKYVDAYAEMDQEMANVRKFTGMTEEQVSSLNEQFRKIDTRTSREQLNQLAQEAGRLGKSSEEDVLGFVRAADKINVALDDIGKGATLKLSKLTGMFGDEERYGTEQSLLKVGSVINELSQNCSASAPYLAEFASRLGGVGQQAGMTIQQIMGFGAVLDANGQKVEASATALSQIIVRLYQDPAKYAKVAGLDAQKFATLMREDANAALLLFLETLHKAGGMDVLSPMFKDMGENGSRAIAALSTLATHIALVKEQQTAANIAFEEGISIEKEFAVQNGTVEAALEKARNHAHELQVELGERLAPLMAHLYTSSAAFMRALLTLVRYTDEYKGEIISLAAAISAYMVISKAQIILSKTVAAYLAIEAAWVRTLAAARTAGNASLILLNATYLLFTGNLGKATAAMRLFNMTVKANPIGLLISALTLAAGWFMSYKNKVNEAAEAEKEAAEEREKHISDFRSGLRDLSKASAEYAEKEVFALKKTYSAATDDTKSKKERLAAVNELKKQYPSYFGQLSTEAIMVGEASKQYENLTDNIYKSAKARAAQDKIYENEKLRLEKEMERDRIQDDIESTATRRNAIQSVYTNKVNSGNIRKLREAKELRPELDETNRKLTELNDAEARLVDELFEIDKTNSWLAEKYAANRDEIRDKVREDAIKPEETPQPVVPYQSAAVLEKEKKKSEAEARRELAKSKAEYKARMESAKGSWELGTAQNISEYGQGLKTYQEFLSEKERLDLKYLDDRIAIYNSLYEGESENDRKLLLMYDEDYQEFLMKRAELTNKHNAAEAKRNVDELKREYGMAVAAAEFEFNSPGSKLYGDTQAQQERLFELKIEYLTKYKNQYKADSKEWIEYERQIQDAEQAQILSRRKHLAQEFENWMNSYTSVSATRRYDIEHRLVDELYEKKKISEEQYQLWLAQLREKYRSETGEATSSAETSRTTVSGPGGDIDIRSTGEQTRARVSDLQAKRDGAIDELKKRLQGGLITQEEYDEGIKKINAAYQENLFAPVREMLDEQTRMLLDLGLAWTDFFEKLSADGKLSFEDIASVASATMATLCAGLQTYSQFADAQKRIDLAAVEKRYEREVQLAQGNSYKVAKAEKQKEAATLKIKQEAARKEFSVKVIQAVAQTAQNALSAYGAMVGIPVIGPTLAVAAASAATAMGLVQIALLKKQQQAAAAEGYSKGGFTKPGPVDEPAGIVHAGEWVASQKLLANPVARPMIEALDHAQRTNTIGSLRPDDVSRSITANNSLVRIAESDKGSLVMAAVAGRMSEAVDALTDRLNEPFVTVNTVTGDKGIKSAQDEYTRLMNNKSPKSKKK